METKDICRFLAQPSAYPHPTTQVDVIETHISWVFLTDHLAYKLKKPVRFEFLDFSTVERRREACSREVELNRSLAPDVYLGVAPVVVDSRYGLCVGGAGEPVDWLVRMKRLPADRALDQLIVAGQLATGDIERLAAMLVSFYAQLPPMSVPTDEYCQKFEHHIRSNWSELSQPDYEFNASAVQRIHGAQLRFLNLCRRSLISRVGAGRVVEGHGDLRPEHIYLTSTPSIIDCIEFSAEFRTIDVVDELAFLAMECDKLGAGWIGQRILDTYVSQSGDQPSAPLVDFFKVYRACVRAKVNALRAKQLKPVLARPLLKTASEYLASATRYAAALGPPFLLVVRGLSGTGKSTLAITLAEAWGARLFQTDVVRQQLFGSAREETAYDTGRYSPGNRQRVYAQLFRHASDSLKSGLSVILDGTFLSREPRAAAIDLAAQHQAEVLLINCRCPPEIALQRVQERWAKGPSPSELRPEFISLQHTQEESDDPQWPLCVVDTSQDPATVQRIIQERLRGQLQLCDR